jgi:hypothetical protein
VNAQPDWAPLEVLGDFMREQALETITAFPWELAQTRGVLDPRDRHTRTPGNSVGQ